MNRALSTIAFLLIILFSIGLYIFLNYEIFTRGYGRIVLYPVEESFEQTIEEVRDIVSDSSRLLSLITDPTSIYYTPAEAKPSEDVIEYSYGVYIYPNTGGIVYPCICTDQNCSYINIPPITVSFTVYSKFPEDLDPKTMVIECITTTSYDDLGCFSNTPINTSEVIDTSITTNVIKCLDPSKEIQLSSDSSCINEEGKYKFSDTGFTIQSDLYVRYNVKSKTFFKSLITTEDIVARAIEEQRSVYTLLDIKNPSEYDTGYYVGLLNHPKINIDRINKKFNANIPLVAVNGSESYDTLILSLDNIESIVKLYNIVIEIYPSSYVGVYNNDGVCSNSGLVYTNGYFDFIASPIDNGIRINMEINKDILNTLENDIGKFWEIFKINNRDLRFIIPICVKEGTYNSIKDLKYYDMIVIAEVDYMYEKTANSAVAVDSCKFIE